MKPLPQTTTKHPLIPPQPIELTWFGKNNLTPKHQSETDYPCRTPQTPNPTPAATSPAALDNQNRLILDHLEHALPHLPIESFDFIYLDPPFMTQKNFAISPGAYRKHQLRLVRSNDDQSLSLTKNTPQKKPSGYSDRWQRTEYLDFLAGALRLLKPLLKKTGTIAVHTDFRASHYVRCLLDEYFSPEQFINEIIWKYGLGNARATRHFLRKHDNIAIYAANRTTPYYFNVLRGEVTKAQKSKYCHEDEHGKFMRSYGKKYYLKGGKPLESVLEIPALSATAGERTGYPTQKPTRLLATLIEALCPPGGRVLDPCCGSGTTAVAAQLSGRMWTAIDANADAVAIAENRLHALKTGKTPLFNVKQPTRCADKK